MRMIKTIVVLQGKFMLFTGPLRFVHWKMWKVVFAGRVMGRRGHNQKQNFRRLVFCSVCRMKWWEEKLQTKRPKSRCAEIMNE